MTVVRVSELELMSRGLVAVRDAAFRAGLSGWHPFTHDWSFRPFSIIFRQHPKWRHYGWWGYRWGWEDERVAKARARLQRIEDAERRREVLHRRFYWWAPYI